MRIEYLIFVFIIGKILNLERTGSLSQNIFNYFFFRFGTLERLRMIMLIAFTKFIIKSPIS